MSEPNFVLSTLDGGNLLEIDTETWKSSTHKSHKQKKKTAKVSLDEKLFLFVLLLHEKPKMSCARWRKVFLLLSKSIGKDAALN